MNVTPNYDAKSRWYSVMAAFMAGHLSEGQARRILDISAVDLREHRDEIEQVADDLWKRYKDHGTTIDDDIKEEAVRNRARGRLLND